MQHVNEDQLYGKIYGKTVMLKDIDFPENSMTVAEMSLQQMPDKMVSQNELALDSLKRERDIKPMWGKHHVNREFFVGHAKPIIYLAHIENGLDLVSIDEGGLVLIWKYEIEFADSTVEAFVPFEKYKLKID